MIATAPDLDGSGQADAFAADLGGRYGNDGSALCQVAVLMQQVTFMFHTAH